MDAEDFRVIEAMRVYGGGFVRALAEAAARADDLNLAQIKATWPGYRRNYQQIAERAAAAPTVGDRL